MPQMAFALAADADVEFAEPDYIARAARVLNDSEYGSQWALEKIGAPAAWDGQTGDPAVVIAVIDSAVDNDLNGQVDDTHGWNVASGNGAVSEPITLTMQVVSEPPAAGGFAVLGQGFRIEAQTLAGAPVTQFAEPLTLVVHYTDTDVADIDENTLQIFYWREAQAAWVAIPTTVDATANTLTAQMDHLTLFAVLYTQETGEQKLYLPSVSR